MKIFYRRVNLLFTTKTTDVNRFAFYQIIKSSTHPKTHQKTKATEDIVKVSYAALPTALHKMYKKLLLSAIKKMPHQTKTDGFNNICKVLFHLVNRKQN